MVSDNRYGKRFASKDLRPGFAPHSRQAQVYINISAATANRDSGTIGGFTGANDQAFTDQPISSTANRVITRFITIISSGSAVGIGDANHCLNGSLSGSAIYCQCSDL